MKLIFLCSSNSCRSQMAEGFAHKLAGGDVAVASAGIEAAGVNPIAIRVMNEIGIDISRQTSDLYDITTIDPDDMIVTVCDKAREMCPRPPHNNRHFHWSIDDPAEATGSEDQILTAFRRVRDELGTRVQQLFDVVPLGKGKLRC